MSTGVSIVTKTFTVHIYPGVHEASQYTATLFVRRIWHKVDSVACAASGKFELVEIA